MAHDELVAASDPGWRHCRVAVSGRVEGPRSVGYWRCDGGSSKKRGIVTGELLVSVANRVSTPGGNR